MTRNTRKDSELTLADQQQREDPGYFFPMHGAALDHSLGESVLLHSAAGHHTCHTIFLWTSRMLLLSYFSGQAEGRDIVTRSQISAA